MTLNYMHNIKKITVMISHNDPSLATKENKIALYDFLRNLGISVLQLEIQNKIFRKILSCLQDWYSKTEQTKPSVDEIKEIIKSAVIEYSPIAVLEQKLRIERKEKPEERKAREAVEVRLATETVARMAAEARVAELTRKRTRDDENDALSAPGFFK